MTMITPPTFDVAFIGSGAACSMTLLEMADALLSSPSASPKLRIAVVERDEQFWCGIPMANAPASDRWPFRSSTISPTSRKRPPTGSGWSRTSSAGWRSSRQRAVRPRPAGSATTATHWTATSGELYLPRFLFGVFLSEQMIAAIAALGERDLAEIVTIRAEAMSAHSADGHYRIGLRPSGNGPTAIAAGKVVVAIGSPRPKPSLRAIPNPHSPISTISTRRGEQRSATARFARPRRVVGEAQRTGRGFQRHLAGSALPNASRRAHPRTRPVHHRHLALRRAALHDLQSAAGV